MKLNKKVSIIAILFFITTFFYNFMPSYATTISEVNPFKTSILINGKSTNGNNPIELTNGKSISIKIKYDRQSELKAGDKITLTVPDSLKDLVAGQYDSSIFNKPIVEGNTITFIANSGIIHTISGYIEAKATLNCNDENQNVNIPITVNGETTIVHTTVSNPGGGSSEGSGSGGGTITHISKTVDGKTSMQVDTLTAQNNSFNFQVKLDTHGLQENNTFLDDMGKGFKYTNGSLQILELINGREVDVTSSLENQTTITSSNIKITNLPINEKYIINYKATIPLEYANGKVNGESKNYASINSDGAMAYVTFNTKANDITPETIKDMVTKSIAPGEDNTYTKVGEVKTYYLNLNPHHVLIKKGSYLIDKMPEGLSLDNTYASACVINQAQQYEDYNFNILSINKDGVKHYVSYDPSSKGTIILNGQTNEMRVDFNEDTQGWVVIYYKATVDKLLNKITNVATLHFDGYTASGQDTLSFSSTSGNIGAWKSTNTKAIFSNGTQEVEGENGKSQIVHQKNNQNVTYEIHVSAKGAFPAEFLNLTDTLNKNVKLNKLPNGQYDIVAPPGYKITVDGQTIKIVNSEDIIAEGSNRYSAVIKINCSLKDVPEGTTVPNSLYANGNLINTVNVKKGYSFKAIKAALSSENSATKDTLTGAEYGVYSEINNQLVEKVTSNKEGIMQGSISEEGSYYLKEIQAPSGYLLSAKEIPFTISKDNVGTTLNLGYIYDKKAPLEGNIKIIKESNTKKVLEGAEFNLIQDGKVIQKGTTDKNGVLEFTNIPIGNYTLVEANAPKGYEKAKNINIEITPGCNKSLSIVDNEVLGSLQVTKLGKDGAKLEGATFEVTGPNDFKKEITTNKDGVVSLKDLAWGTYKIKETKAPVGYSLNNTVQTITINNENASKMQGVVVTDGQILGTLQVTKTNESGTPLEGATFNVSGADGFSKDITTGKDGIATLANLPWGTYTVKETKAPVGYNLSPESQQVVVTKDSVGGIQKLSFKDTQTTGIVKISKVDITNEKEVAGAKIV
ncbi:MAG: MSCRAMM family protein, partial [Clostridium sp.]